MIDLWNPVHTSITLDLVTAFFLGILHGVTPDEHTWPITFSYAVGSYSTKAGMRAGLLFSFSFTLQRAIGCELAYFGFGKLLQYPALEPFILGVVGVVMIASAIMISRGRLTPHLHFGLLDKKRTAPDLVNAKAWMPLLHGFIAGWGFGAFAIILYTVLAPAMPSAVIAFAPGLLFGLGTMVTQLLIGAAVGAFIAHRKIPIATIRELALLTASRTLFWGGIGIALLGILKVAAPNIADFSIATGIHIHNLDTLDLSLVVVLLAVFGVGFGGLAFELHSLAQRNPAGET